MRVLAFTLLLVSAATIALGSVILIGTLFFRAKTAQGSPTPFIVTGLLILGGGIWLGRWSWRKLDWQSLWWELNREDPTAVSEQTLEAVRELVGLYFNTDAYLASVRADSPHGKLVARIRAIGEELNQRGGKPLMRWAHAAFARERPRAARNLEILWHGIGDWQG